MVIIGQGKENLKIHDLLRLVALADLKLSDTQLTFLKELNQYYSHSRYPDMAHKPFPRLAQTMSQTLFDTANELFLWLTQQAKN